MELNLITYGITNFNPGRFQPVKNNNFVKPIGGLWASPTDSVYGWRRWCQEEGYRFLKGFKRSFTFTFSGNIVVVDSYYDLQRLDWVTEGPMPYPDFEQMVNSGIDAIFLTARGQRETRLTHPLSLYGWDCECVLIMNPKGIRTK